MGSPQENEETVRAAYAALAEGDARRFFASLDPAIEVHEPPSLPHGGSYRGIDELKGMFAQAMQLLAPGQVTVEECTAQDDRVVVLLRLGLKEGGEALVCERWRLHEGKAVELRVFWFDPPQAPPVGQ